MRDLRSGVVERNLTVYPRTVGLARDFEDWPRQHMLEKVLATEVHTVYEGKGVLQI